MFTLQFSSSILLFAIFNSYSQIVSDLFLKDLFFKDLCQKAFFEHNCIVLLQDSYKNDKNKCKLNAKQSENFIIQNQRFNFEIIKMQKYRKVNVVGKGSFGYAVLVQNKKNKKQYIMKIIDISKMDEKQIQEALMEVHLLKVMRYPYVVTYRESFMEKMCLCIVMDYCEGGDMYHKIAKQRQLGKLFPEPQIITWFVQMVLAMNYVHDKKILHRDLKTQNIFLTSKGDIKIGDFGIARVLQHTYDCANTAIGTPYYLSPQICQQKPYNQKSDIWSLGCIFYEIATLNHAFDAQNMKGLVQKILKGTYPPLPEVYSSDLKKLISQMLIKDPNKRPSIRKILEMPFMKAKVNELFSSTIKIHELKLQKQSTLNRSELFKNIENQKPPIEVKKLSRDSREKTPVAPGSMNMFKKKEQSSRQKKIELVSKNNSGVSFKKNIPNPVLTSECNKDANKLLPKRIPLKEQNSTSRSQKMQTSKQKEKERSKQRPHGQQNTPKDKDKSFNKDSHKKSVYEEQQTLEEQGYGVLLRDMKRCIKGESGDEQEERVENQRRVEEKITPTYLKLHRVPGVSERDTVGSKIEALRDYLEKQVGQMFFTAYKLIQDEKDEDYVGVKKILGDKSKFIPLILQLIVCEDSYY